MSTIASPRDPSAPFPRRAHSSQNIVSTPTSSTRPSMDNGPRSTQSSPIPVSNASTVAPAKRNRAALREYYNLKKTATPAPGTPTLEITDALGETTLPSSTSSSSHSEIPPSELDSPSFDAEAYVRSALSSSGLADLLRLYARVLGEMRALDAEKKALVYDNYSKLIAATETIRRMRTNMDPLNPVASTLDPAIGRVYEMARDCREGIKAQIEEGRGDEERQRLERRKRTREVVREVLGVPDRLRVLVAQGKIEEARREWELPRRLLVSWKEKGAGGGDVDVCIREGDAAVREAEDSSGDDESDGGEANH
ncbi:Vps51 domain-containing protein [Coniochaeta hoffmannii]|uniref:Vacuolar protein sorting-associated protein 51 homolog n=1 Tax=Coniochaeta hoffmannii TaxID=91930 RepID=A0AA38RG49_9PEZI|nr:Vps51 domain-containing protein [Coniochaeta hoffmannii]